MSVDRLRRPFIPLHLSVGLVVLVGSVRTTFGAVQHGAPVGGNLHLVLLGMIEAIGALLFLLPKCTRVGGTIMLVTFGIAIVAHALQRQFPGFLLVYAAATWVVMVDGGLWRPAPTHQASTT
jgi:hypothetical protein